MQVKKRSLRDLLHGFLLLSHPLPVFFHLLGVTIFALLAAGLHPLWSVVLLVVAAHTAMQIAIAMLNDYCDRTMDAAGKPTKPIPLGLVTPREALIAGCAMIGLMALLLLPLPRLAALISLLYLALGLGYNLGLKSTPLSGIVFALALPLIPLYAFAGVGRTLPLFFLFVPTGFLLGVALNLANSLPDLEEDAAAGARTLAVVLGVKWTFYSGDTLLLLSGLLILFLHLAGIVPVQPLVLAGTLLLALALFVALLLFTGNNKPRSTRKLYFYLVTLLCLVLAGGWLLGALT
jgi:4-hydroxybenzoate polyprenyltransferase